tara:strand:- start:436 stop:570 length:135 start_codon:yes stop_codon:yes gene_type:complete
MGLALHGKRNRVLEHEFWVIGDAHGHFYEPATNCLNLDLKSVNF